MSKKDVQPKTQEEKTKDFVEEYQKLCEKHGMRIVVNPAFKARDDGTWSIVQQTSVGLLPQEEE